MIAVVEDRPQSVSRALLKMRLSDGECAPRRVRIVVRASDGGCLADVNYWDGAALAPPSGVIPWARKVAEINSRIDALHASLERFRDRWSTEYLDAFERDPLPRDRLATAGPLCDWGELADPRSKAYDVLPADDARWRKAAASRELRELAIAGSRLYVAIFGPHAELKTWMRELSPGGRLSVYWTREDHGAIQSIPWPLLYRGGEPKPGEEVDPLGFLGLSLRLELNESWSTSSLALGSPAKSFRGHLFFWRGKDAACAEALDQYQSWSGQPNFHAVPHPLPAAIKDDEIKPLATRLLEAEQPDPMTLVYVYCQCELKDASPELYFGSPFGPDVTIVESDLPAPGSRYRREPLVFLNACSTSAPAGPARANLLETNFLERGCRAYLGTVNRVPTRAASLFAQAFFHFFLPRPGAMPASAGEAVSQARLFLWTRYRNLAGLYYKYINDYDIYMEDEDALMARAAAPAARARPPTGE